MASINVCWIKWIRTKRPAKWRIFIKKTVDFVFWVQFYPVIHYIALFFPFSSPVFERMSTFLDFFLKVWIIKVTSISEERTQERSNSTVHIPLAHPKVQWCVYVCVYNFATPENSSKLRSRHLVFVSKRIIDLIFTLKPIWKH